jgi:hypothetical protein
VNSSARYLLSPDDSPPRKCQLRSDDKYIEKHLLPQPWTSRSHSCCRLALKQEQRTHRRIRRRDTLRSDRAPEEAAFIAGASSPRATDDCPRTASSLGWKLALGTRRRRETLRWWCERPTKDGAHPTTGTLLNSALRQCGVSKTTRSPVVDPRLDHFAPHCGRPFEGLCSLAPAHCTACGPRADGFLRARRYVKCRTVRSRN